METMKVPKEVFESMKREIEGNRKIIHILKMNIREDINANDNHKTK